MKNGIEFTLHSGWRTWLTVDFNTISDGTDAPDIILQYSDWNPIVEPVVTRRDPIVEEQTVPEDNCVGNEATESDCDENGENDIDSTNDTAHVFSWEVESEDC